MGLPFVQIARSGDGDSGQLNSLLGECVSGCVLARVFHPLLADANAPWMAPDVAEAHADEDLLKREASAAPPATLERTPEANAPKTTASPQNDAAAPREHTTAPQSDAAAQDSLEAGSDDAQDALEPPVGLEHTAALQSEAATQDAPELPEKRDALEPVHVVAMQGNA